MATKGYVGSDSGNTAGPLYYVEGTWVPALTFTGGAGNTTPVYTVNSGTYTRIGRLVFFNIQLSGDGGDEGAGTGQLTVSLPFTTSASQLAIRVDAGTALNGSNEHAVWMTLGPAASTAVLWKDDIVGANLEQAALLGSDQNNASRAINIQGKILV